MYIGWSGSILAGGIQAGSFKIIAIITIDGPSGVGKGTISTMLAQYLGWHFLDSGALYRICAYAAQKAGLSEADPLEIAKLARDLPVRFCENPVTKKSQIFLGDEEITQAIRQEEISNLASRIATFLPIREALHALQRSFAKTPGLVADGRDMGTIVFPEARHKFFLTASSQVRAQRRFKQLQQAGIHVNMDDLRAEIEARDHRDQTRKVRPLKPAEDALVIDTSDLSIDEVFNTVLRVVNA